MNWSLRYAVTRDSIAELRSVLPDGWQIGPYGQPSDSMWDRKQYYDFSTPDVIKVHNPTTGNSLLVLDHSKFNESTNMNEYWNPRQHGDFINAAAQHLDKLGSNITLHMGRSGHDLIASKYNQSDVGAWFDSSDKSKMGVLYVQNPMHHMDVAKKTNFNHAINNVLYAITHEYGHKISHTRPDGSITTELDPAIFTVAKNYYTMNNDPLLHPEIMMHDDPLLVGTAPSQYGSENWHEHYAEHYAHYKLGIKSLQPTLTNLLGSTLGWGKKIKPDDWFRR